MVNEQVHGKRGQENKVGQALNTVGWLCCRLGNLGKAIAVQTQDRTVVPAKFQSSMMPLRSV